MRIATWNVNSLKVRLTQVVDWAARHRPDVIALQEIKQTDDALDVDTIGAGGYRVLSNGQKTYNGVALLTRAEPRDVVTELDDYDDPARRYLAASVEGVRIVNVYVPNGQSVDSDKYRYKLAWLDALAATLEREIARHDRIVLLGDFNIAPRDADVFDPELWADSVLTSEPVRAALARLEALGLVDLFREFEQPPGSFSWWDYRAAAFRRNRGLRIDLILGSALMRKRCESVLIDAEPRGWERPSDHAPVLAEFVSG